MNSFLVGAGGFLAGLILGSPTSRRLAQAIWHNKILLQNEKIKLVIVVRTDLGISSGKVAAQCAHAAVISYRNAEVQSPQLCQSWLNTGQQKVVVKSDKPGESVLLNYVKLAKSKGLVTSTVIDAGHTQVQRGTLTVVGIGHFLHIFLDNLA